MSCHFLKVLKILLLEHYLCSEKLLSVIYIIWKLCVLQTLRETVQSS